MRNKPAVVYLRLCAGGEYKIERMDNLLVLQVRGKTDSERNKRVDDYLTEEQAQYVLSQRDIKVVAHGMRD